LRTGLDPNGSDQCQVLSNQISGFTGAAISIESPVRDLIVKMNQIERCGNGIVLEGASNTASVSIENNHLSEIGGEDDASTFAAGILVTRAVAASVSGNVVQRIGLQTLRGSLRVGIAATGVQRLQVNGNTVADIAPPGDFIGIGAGVVVLAPSADVDVKQNHVCRELQPTSQGTSRTSWFALLMDQPVGERVVSRVATRAAVRLDESRTLVFGNARPFVVAAPVITDVTGAAAVRGTSTTILGNMLEARGSTSAIQVEVTGDCLFSDNRCELIANLSTAAVRLAARTTILNANRIRGGELAVDLNCDPKRVTVLGNITTAAIRVAGGQLETKWEQLNVRGA
jgi:parallel beta helix pectate lyase-like protein